MLNLATFCINNPKNVQTTMLSPTWIWSKTLKMMETIMTMLGNLFSKKHKVLGICCWTWPDFLAKTLNLQNFNEKQFWIWPHFLWSSPKLISKNNQSEKIFSKRPNNLQATMLNLSWFFCKNLQTFWRKMLIWTDLLEEASSLGTTMLNLRIFSTEKPKTLQTTMLNLTGFFGKNPETLEKEKLPSDQTLY